MTWWNDFVDWLTSADARPALFSAAVLAVAIIVSGLLAAGIAGRAVKRLLVRTDRTQKSSAIAALVDAATEASVWNSLTPQEQVLSDRAIGQADVQVRLLPIKGAGLAANWAGHQLAEMKRNSATFGYQLEPAIAELRDRLIEWQYKPTRARRIFQEDLEGWRSSGSDAQRALLARQDSWAANQHHEQFTKPPVPAQTHRAQAGEPAAHADETGADTETQRLIDDVEALDARREQTSGAAHTAGADYTRAERSA